MLGQQIAPTEYDLRFRCFGFPVRVSPWFWLTSAIVIWNVSERLDHKLVGVLAVFISILIHELGHAFAIRHYGGRSEIVLQFFGGYATCNVNPSRMGNIIIAAAGPAAGFLLWGVLRLLVRQFPLQIATSHDYVLTLLDVLLWANWSWRLLNLIPVWPLDGGRIAHLVIGRFRAFDSWELALKLSIAVCAGMVAWCAFEFAQHGDGDHFLMIMFAILGFQNFQTLQASTRGRW
jgi:stage IV sporulation protein FB